MSQKPLSQMADLGYEKMSEESGYILAELKPVITMLSNRLEAAEERIADFQCVVAALDNLVNKDEFREFVADYNRRVVDTMQPAEIISILNVISNKISKLRAANISIAAKLDDEVGLADDYESSTETVLSGV